MDTFSVVLLSLILLTNIAGLALLFFLTSRRDRSSIATRDQLAAALESIRAEVAGIRAGQKQNHVDLFKALDVILARSIESRKAAAEMLAAAIRSDAGEKNDRLHAMLDEQVSTARDQALATVKAETGAKLDKLYSMLNEQIKV